MVALTVILVVAAISRFSDRIADIKKRVEPAEARVAVQEKKIEVAVYPDRYTEVPLPYYHWFDFGFDDDFQVKLADGKEDTYEFKVGQPKPFLGNEIPENRLELKSLAGKEIKITIFLRPKLRS
jgi:hypothetical protein